MISKLPMKRFSLLLLGLLTLLPAPLMAQEVDVNGMYIWRGNRVPEQQYNVLSYYDLNPASPGSTILFGGTVFAGAQWAEIFPKANVRTYAALYGSIPLMVRQVPQVAESRPKKVLILAGESSASTLEGGSKALSLLQMVVQDMRRKAGGTELIIVTLPTVADEQKAKAIRSYNDRLKRLAKAYGAQVIDFGAAMDEARKEGRTFLMKRDGRLGTTGVEILASLMAPHIGACRICL